MFNCEKKKEGSVKGKGEPGKITPMEEFNFSESTAQLTQEAVG